MGEHVLVLENVRVVDTARGIDGIADLAFADGMVATTPAGLANEQQVVDGSGLLAVPGLLDLHTHVFPGNPISLDADTIVRNTGAPVVVDAGTSGWLTFTAHSPQLRTRPYPVLVFLNLSSYGLLTNIAGVGELSRPEFVDEERTLDCLLANLDVCVGLKVRLGDDAVGDRDPIGLLEQALSVATKAGCPVMVHVADLRRSLSAVLDLLRPGDIVTHIFHGGTSGLTGDPGALDDVSSARARGVFFDVGYGNRHFHAAALDLAIGRDFLPDTISSDAHLSLRGTPVPGLVTFLSEVVQRGVPLEHVISSVTTAPRNQLMRYCTPAIREWLSRTGTFAPGSVGNALLLGPGAHGFETAGVVVGGVVHWLLPASRAHDKLNPMLTDRYTDE